MEDSRMSSRTLGTLCLVQHLATHQHRVVRDGIARDVLAAHFLVHSKYFVNAARTCKALQDDGIITMLAQALCSSDPIWLWMSSQASSAWPFATNASVMQPRVIEVGFPPHFYISCLNSRTRIMTPVCLCALIMEPYVSAVRLTNPPLLLYRRMSSERRSGCLMWMHASMTEENTPH